MGDQPLPFPLTERSVHLRVDMQRIFSAEGPWPTPWMDRASPVVAELASRRPERTVFTHFIPPAALLHTLARGQPGMSRSRVAGVDAAAGGAMSSGSAGARGRCPDCFGV
jgi:nicotinamidase-related amidase